MAIDEQVTAIHPAKRLGALIKAEIYYFTSHSLSLMLGVTEEDILDLTEGIQTAFTDDMIFIIPYLANASSKVKKEYAKLHEECKQAPKLGIADVFMDADFKISVSLNRAPYRRFNLTEKQHQQILKIILGKKKTDDTQEVLTV